MVSPQILQPTLPKAFLVQKLWYLPWLLFILIILSNCLTPWNVDSFDEWNDVLESNNIEEFVRHYSFKKYELVLEYK